MHANRQKPDFPFCTEDEDVNRRNIGETNTFNLSVRSLNRISESPEYPVCLLDISVERRSEEEADIKMVMKQKLERGSLTVVGESSGRRIYAGKRHIILKNF